MSLHKPVFLTSLLIFSTAVIPSALAGPGGTGGGLAHGGTVLDLYEQSQSIIGIKDFDPSSTRAYREYLDPVLKEVDAKVPGLAYAIRSSLTEKKWGLTKAELARSNDECLMFKTSLTQVGRQDERHVYISESWFKKATPGNQAALILHEMVMHAYLEKNPGGCSSNVREMVRLVLSGKGSAEELRNEASDLGFGYFSTRAEVDEQNQAFRSAADQICRAIPAFHSYDDRLAYQKRIEAVSDSLESVAQSMKESDLGIDDAFKTPLLILTEASKIWDDADGLTTQYQASACKSLTDLVKRYDPKDAAPIETASSSKENTSSVKAVESAPVSQDPSGSALNAASAR